MSDETPDSLIPYDEIVQEALRAVVGRVLGEVEATGRLPGEHHFYITFKTGAAGRRHPAASRRALPRRDDHRHPEPLLGSEGARRRLRGRASASTRRRRSSPSPSPRSPASSIRRSISRCSSRRRAEEGALDEHEQAENDPPARRADRGRLQRGLGRFQPEEVTACAAAARRRGPARSPRAAHAQPGQAAERRPADTLRYPYVAALSRGDRRRARLFLRRHADRAALDPDRRPLLPQSARRAASAARASGPRSAQAGSARCPTRRRSRVARIVVHPGLRRRQSQDNDIALVRLVERGRAADRRDRDGAAARRSRRGRPCSASAASTKAGSPPTPCRGPARRPSQALGPAAAGGGATSSIPRPARRGSASAAAATGARQICAGAGPRRDLRRRFGRPAGRRGRRRRRSGGRDRQLRLGLRRRRGRSPSTPASRPMRAGSPRRSRSLIALHPRPIVQSDGTSGTR